MKKGFTLIEMIFVIVIMGILAKFGSEIFRNIYLNYTQSTANNELQIDTQLVLQQIGNRLQYRIKDSVIARENAANFVSLTNASPDTNYTAFEWVGYDIDGWLGDDTNTSPTWSGFIDVSNPAATTTLLISPSSDFTAGGRVDTVIQALGGDSITTTRKPAIFFTGSNSDAQTDYGWNGVAIADLNNTAAFPVTTAAVNRIVPGVDNFSGVDVYEQYNLAWTAYALEVDTNETLRLYYNYQPWNGEQYNVDGTSAILAQNVSSTRLRVIGDMINIQICINENNITGSEYSICKEKAIF